MSERPFEAPPPRGPGEPGPGRGGAWEPLARGDLARLAYRLGRAGATGVLTIRIPRGRPEVLILRRGHLITAEHDAHGRAAAQRLARLAAVDGAAWSFDGGTAAYPPGATGRQLDLAAWARGHLEAQLDGGLAERLIAELAGVRLAVRADRAPAPVDDTDRRLLAAMAQPRRLDEIGACARAPRFRLLAFVHVLRAVGALTVVGVGAGRALPGSAPPPRAAADPRAAALRLLGVDGDAPREVVKRAYRRLARALHPDLHPGLPDARRRELEAKLAAVTAAYEQLV